jgi:sigma-B regulation protein RsbU (phosphoserine phosphatase)
MPVTSSTSAPSGSEAKSTQAGEAAPRPIRVLLIDDQPIVGESVRRMLAAEQDIELHYCSDPTQALKQANALAPTVILQDLVMPEVDGLTLVRYLRANPHTRDVPLIVLSSKEEPAVKAQAFALGANDYLVKLPDKVELVARVRYHSRGYQALLERNEAYRRLAESRQELANEIDQAARYVRSLLPDPAPEAPIRVDWRFEPSAQLGGDSFGYHWLDDDHFAMYLLDVSGHGVGSSLLSVSAMNTLRAQTLPRIDFRQPSEVLAGLDAAYDMERQGGKYFTIWYGVYRPSNRKLEFAGAGHPAALLLGGATLADARQAALESQGPWIGSGLELPFEANELELPPFSRLYLYSDGAFEVHQPSSDQMWTLEEMMDYLGGLREQPGRMDTLLEHVKARREGLPLEDDLSIVEFEFGEMPPPAAKRRGKG